MLTDADVQVLKCYAVQLAQQITVSNKYGFFTKLPGLQSSLSKTIDYINAIDSCPLLPYELQCEIEDYVDDIRKICTRKLEDCSQRATVLLCEIIATDLSVGPSDCLTYTIDILPIEVT